MSEETPTELTKVARDLSEIVALHDTLEDQAVHRGGDPQMPGGTAMVMLAPVANLPGTARKRGRCERV